MFNLSKHADFVSMVGDAGEALEEGIERPEDVTRTEDDLIGDLGPDSDEKERVLQLQQEQELIRTLNDLKGTYPGEVDAINAVLTNTNSFRQLQNELAGLPALTEQHSLETLTPQIPSFDEYKVRNDQILQVVRRLNAIRREQERSQLPLVAFNLREFKKAQMQRFPVINEGDFIAKFIDDLLAFNNKPGTAEYERARSATEEIRSAVSPGFAEEANSILESIMQLDQTEKDRAASYLLKLYQVLIPEALKGQQTMEPVMSENNEDTIEGIVRFSLTDNIQNNKCDGCQGKMTKTAADQFGQHYVLYGPTEKRICPKLRGKNLSVGDVVSEYTCRHHCIDGIVIDDNKTICGEALWRANAMDKYSREYVDEDGNIEGGYLNKRFEINRNVPEENKMRLKPGETRKPRPPAWGNLESRMQDMRAKEGQNRDYRPETNTGDAFDWSSDDKQNNVQVSQAERDRRETAAGHESVQYTNRDQAENKPKKQAFNLQEFKTAQCSQCPAKPMQFGQEFEEEKFDWTAGTRRIRAMDDAALAYTLEDLNKVIAEQETWVNNPAAPSPKKLGYYYDERHTVIGEINRRKGTSAFNLKDHKEAKSPPGFKHTVEHMKEKHPELSKGKTDEGKEKNPWALAWWMKNEGHKSHKGPGDVHKCDDDKGKKDDKDMKSAETENSKKKT